MRALGLGGRLLTATDKGGRGCPCGWNSSAGLSAVMTDSPEALRERRAPTSTLFEVELDPASIRPQLRRALKRSRGLDPELARRARILLGQLTANWLALEGPSSTAAPIVKVRAKSSGIRIDVSATSSALADDFWLKLVTPAIEELATAWGIDARQGGEGTWFELALSEAPGPSPVSSPDSG
jgi:hypothetical protein